MIDPTEWGAEPVEEAADPRAWGAVPVEDEQPPDHRGFMSRVSGGFSHVLPDIGDMFMEGVHATMRAPGQILGAVPGSNADLGPARENQLVTIGASEQEAKREADRMVTRLQRTEGVFNLAMGPLQAVTAPLFGPFRSFVSRPIEETTGFPHEATEVLAQSALAAAGLRPHTVARVRVSRTGEVTATPIGELPKAEDFSNAATVISPEKIVGAAKPQFFIGTEEPFSSERLGVGGTGRNEKAVFLAPTEALARDYGRVVTPIRLEAKNPKTIDWLKREGASDSNEPSWWNETDMAREIDKARAEGHDVLFVENIEEQGTRHGLHTQVAVLDHDRIKPIIPPPRPLATVTAALSDARIQLSDAQEKWEAANAQGKYPHLLHQKVMEVETQIKVLEDELSRSSQITYQNGRAITEENLRDLWDDHGIHPAEAAHDAQHDAFLREQLTRPNPDPKDRSGIVPVQGSTIPEGTPRTYLAQTGEPHIDSVLDSAVTNRNIDNPVIVDTYDVPYGAGGSVPLEDPQVFIDRHFPRSMTIDGVTFDPADPFTIHENIEQHVMDVLTRGYRQGPEQAFPDLGRRSGQFELPIKAGNENIGKLEFTVDDNSVEVRGAYVEGDYQGKGFGIASYQRLADWALSTGRELRSGSNVSAQAARMYSALERRGYTVERDPKLVTNHLGAASAPGSAFRVIAGPRQLGPMDPATAYKVAHHEWAEKAEGAWYRAHGIDQAKAEAAYQPFLDQIEHENPTNPPPNLYEKPYPHQDVRSAEAGPVEKPTAAEIARAKEIMAADRASGDLSEVGAAITPPGALPSLAAEPPPPPGRLVAAIKDAGTKLLDIGRDIQMKVSPMVRGTQEAMAIAKDFANTMRRNRWEWSRVDQDIVRRFTPEQRKRMWDAADEESVALQLGESREHQGLITLEPEERAAVEDLQARSQAAWAQARDLGMVEGEGLPAYTPRMLINVAQAGGEQRALPLNVIGQNVRTRTAQMLHREHMMAEETEAAAKAKLGEGAEIARDIRALPLATAKLEDAVAGRTLINAIEDAGRRTGDETISVGSDPGRGWFTLDHPAFKKWRPKFDPETGVPLKDENGNIIFEKVPIYVRGDFEGPLRAVMTQPSGAAYGALMSLKGKTMGLIMNSPLIHNAVEWGRALPAMPGKVITFRVYFDGNRAKNNPVVMREAIDAGLVPIGKRFFNQDITSIMEEPNLAPGRSFTAQVLGFVPGLFDEGAGNAVKAAIDKAGDFWHNTLLWDRVGDLQMGLYTNFRDGLMAKGVDRQTAARAAAHWANRYAGALPEEAMSANARKISNFLMFSRSFTLGNLGAMKDMLTGLPKDVMAQIERDGGMLDPKAVRSIAVRKAIAIVTLDMGLMYVGNSILQNTSNVLRQDTTLDKEMRGYAERLSASLQETKEHPLGLLFPIPVISEAMRTAERTSSTSQNEPGLGERILVGHASDGTAIYARNPAGKIGEEFSGYLTSPLDMIKRKLGTLARPLWQIMANDKGFGHKIYDPNADVPAKYLANMGAIAKHLAEAQLPESQIAALMDLVKGDGDPKVNALQAFGPIAGVTFRKGAPGGPALGELYHARDMHQYAVDAAMPDIRKQIQRGDIDGARDRMNELGIPAGLQRYYIRTTQNPAMRLSPKALRDFYLYGTPEQRQRLENAR